MKKIFIYFILCSIGILCILLSFKCWFKENIDSKKITTTLQKKKQEQPVKTLNDLKQKGYRIIENQPFDVDLKNYPNCRFISTTVEVNGLFKVVFYLIDRNDNIIYRFPEFYGNSFGNIYSIKAVSFVDINNDNLRDIIIISEYMTGVGEQGAIPRPIANIYIQQDKYFITDLELNKKINTQNNNTTIENIIKYIKTHIRVQLERLTYI